MTCFLWPHRPCFFPLPLLEPAVPLAVPPQTPGPPDPRAFASDIPSAPDQIPCILIVHSLASFRSLLRCHLCNETFLIPLVPSLLYFSQQYLPLTGMLYILINMLLLCLSIAPPTHTHTQISFRRKEISLMLLTLIRRKGTTLEMHINLLLF